jgi:hypothetical protein
METESSLQNVVLNKKKKNWRMDNVQKVNYFTIMGYIALNCRTAVPDKTSGSDYNLL